MTIHSNLQRRAPRTVLYLLIALALLSACQQAAGSPAASTAPAVTNATPAPSLTTGPAATPTPPAEAAITRIPLSGLLAQTKAEISGLSWARDALVLLPQYPARMAERPGGALFTLPRQEIIDYLDGKLPGPLEPRPLPLDSGGLEKSIEGFEGFEAIAFHDRDAYLTIEASPGGKMMSYVVRGRLADDGSALRLDAASLVNVPLDLQIVNYSNEAIVIQGERVLLFYEANGKAATQQALAHGYHLDLQEAGTQPLPSLEYRITDATQPDAQGRFWVSNVFFPGDIFIIPGRDPLVEQYGQGRSHRGASVVERLVPMQLGTDGQVSLAPLPPVQIQLAEGQVPRNWEGIARLEGRGFLLATDKYPETILAFVPGQP